MKSKQLAKYFREYKKNIFLLYIYVNGYGSCPLVVPKFDMRTGDIIFLSFQLF